MYNEFEDKPGMKAVNFRNATTKRDNVTAIEIRYGNEQIMSIRIEPEDNPAMALSILGIGRVTDEVEQLAHDAMSGGKTEEDLIRFAVINLRAIQLLREEKETATINEQKAAYELYLLAYPKATRDFLSFKELSLMDHWISVLRKMRQDPTALGSL
jgi:hypothetical protein